MVFLYGVLIGMYLLSVFTILFVCCICQHNIELIRSLYSKINTYPYIAIIEIESIGTYVIIKHFK